MSATTAWREAGAVDVLERLRLALPVTDPDRHALDVVADDLFARLAPGYTLGGAA